MASEGHVEGLLPYYVSNELIAHVPQSQDAPTRAKAANPTTLLTRFAEELRRAPAAGGGGGEYDFQFCPAFAGHAFGFRSTA